MLERKEITISEFAHEVSTTPEGVVDVNALLNVHGSSPVRAYYKTDKVIVLDVFPESILLMSGDNYISVGQIKKIFRCVGLAVTTYEIVCGRLAEDKTSVKFSQIIK